jgi:hypothetical protein
MDGFRNLVMEDAEPVARWPLAYESESDLSLVLDGERGEAAPVAVIETLSVDPDACWYMY